MSFREVWSFTLLFAYLFFCIVLFIVSAARFIRRNDGGKIPSKSEVAKHICGVVFSVASFLWLVVASMQAG